MNKTTPLGNSCPACGYPSTGVAWIRHHPGFTLRRRKCPECGAKFSTRETRIGPINTGVNQIAAAIALSPVFPSESSTIPPRSIQ